MICHHIQVFKSPFLTTFYVLHYGPNEGSKTGKEEVIRYRHGLPDESWSEPDPTDPLSLVDQVIHYFLEDILEI